MDLFGVRLLTFPSSEAFEQATFNYSRMFRFLWVASATLELVKAPELSIRSVDGRRPAVVGDAQPRDAR